MIHPIAKRTFALCCAAFAGLFSVKASADVPQSFSIYSLEETNVYDRASLNCGNIGSNKKITIGSEAPIRGSVFAGTTVNLKDRASVNGNVTAGGLIVKGSGVYISGTQSPNTPVTTYTIPTIAVTPGSQNIDVANNGSRTLDPGAYGTILVRDRATLRLNAGTFQFRSLTLGNDAHLVLNFNGSQSVTINVANDIIFLDRVIFEYADNPDFSKVKIYTGTTNTVKLGYDMRFAAFLSAPRAKVEISDRVNFQGAIHGKYVDVKYDTKNELQIPTGEGVIAVVKKVVNNGDGTYTVQFGYVNNGSKIVVVPVGVNNYMTGLPGGNQDVGQITTFYPGQVEIAFSVITDFTGSSSIGWVLYGGDSEHTTQIIVGPGNVVTDDLPVLPTINRVVSNCNGTYTATFGYISSNTVIARVDVGPLNYFTGTSNVNAGQPYLFKTGSHPSEFDVTFSGSSIEWTLQGTTITANASDALLSCLSVQPVLTAVVENSDGSAKAVFGYNNPNQISVSRQVTAINNYFAGTAISEVGQPTTFDTGSVTEAFSVDFTESQISWTLDGVTVTAAKASATDRDFGMWTSDYIGGVSGNYTLRGAAMVISVTGVSGTPTNDRVYFVNYQSNLNFDIKTKIAATASSVQKAGLMVRSGVNDNAQFFAVKVTNTGTVVKEYRGVEGNAYTTTTIGTAIQNPWIRIVRSGSVFTAYLSTDGANWTSGGSQVVSMPSDVHLGLSMEGNSGSIAQRVFKDINVSFVDGNGNQIPDIVESIIGGSLAGLPHRSHWTNEGIATIVTDNYSSVTGYAHCTSVKSSYSHAEVEGAILPVNQLVDAATAPVPVTPGLTIDGGKLHSITGNVKHFDRVIQAFPISTQFRGIPKELLQLDHYNNSTNQWEPVAIEEVTTDAAYAKVKSYSFYRLSTSYEIRPIVTNGSELEEQLNYISTNVLPTGKNRWAILCLGSETGGGIVYRPTSSTVFTAFTIPANVLVLGGIPSTAVVPSGQAIVSDPKKYKSVLTIAAGTGIKQIVVNMSVTLTGGEERHMRRTIDGFIIRGGDNLGSSWSAGGLRIAGIGGHVYKDTIRNCVVENNTGTNAGGIIVANALEVDISNCVFQNNIQTPDPASTASKDGRKYGGSAILLTLGGSCHCDAKVRNCVFLGNVANGPAYSGAVTLFGDYDMAGNDVSVPAAGSTFFTDGYIQNCTFYGNTATVPEVLTAATCAGGLVKKTPAATFDRMTVENCIIRNNIPTNVNAYLSNSQIKYTNIGDVSVQAATPSNASVEHNLNQDPGFVGGTGTISNADGLNLLYGSACKNAGKNIDGLTTDIRGYARLINSYDMGAFENYIRVLTVGDGNTVGNNGVTYRAYLRNLMIAANREVDFIGTSIAKPYMPASSSEWSNVTDVPTVALRDAPDREHDGDYSNSIANLIGATASNPIPAPAAVNVAIGTYLDNTVRSNFDVLLLAVGNNDVYDASGAATAAATISTNYTNLINGIRNWILTNTTSAGLNKFVAAKLTPFGANPDETDAVNLRDQLNSCVTLVNSNTLFTNADATADMYNGATDVLHTQIVDGDEDDLFIKRYFNLSGAPTLAARWWAALNPILP